MSVFMLVYFGYQPQKECIFTGGSCQKSAPKSCGLSNLATLASLVCMSSVAKQNILARPTKLVKVARTNRPRLFGSILVAATTCENSLFLRLVPKVDLHKN